MRKIDPNPDFEVEIGFINILNFELNSINLSSAESSYKLVESKIIKVSFMLSIWKILARNS